MTSAKNFYDFTIWNSDQATVKEWCKNYCKKWVFQSEACPTTGRQHFQGRVSLIVRKRFSEVLKIKDGLDMDLSLTSTEGSKSFSYVMKKETRLNGPWADNDPVPPYIPRQIRDICDLWSWQEDVVRKLKDWDTRHINVVITAGNDGKSTLLGYIRAHQLGRVLPSVNDSKDMLRMVCDMPTSNAYLFDMPRAMTKDKLFGFYSAIETIKDGYAYDDRYRFVEKSFDCPNIWIFTNKKPDENLLTRDRWLYWTVTEMMLVPIEDVLSSASPPDHLW